MDKLYKRGDPHPKKEGLFYVGTRPSGKIYWASAEQLEATRKAARDWRRRNASDQNRKAKTDRKQNPQKHSEYSKKYRAKNCRKEYFKKRREQNYESVLEIERRSRKINAAFQRMSKNKKNLHKRKTRRHEETKLLQHLYEARDRISKCLNIQFHVDHIVPLSLGGMHIMANLQLVPAKWNLEKNNKNKDVFEFNHSQIDSHPAYHKAVEKEIKRWLRLP